MVQGNQQIPSHASLSPLLPSEPVLEVMRGPTGGAVVEIQSDNPTKHVRAEDGHPPPRMEVCAVVDLLNQFCKQKPAGSFELPQLPLSQYCLICNQGSICLGSGCKGKEGSRCTRKKVTPISTFSSAIPGLTLSCPTSIPTTVLTERDRTHNQRLSISALNPQSPLFNPKTNTPSLKTRPPVKVEKQKASKTGS